MKTIEKKLNVRKTYKLYIGGKFPRSESGRHISLKNKEGDIIANVSRASRKDVRMAVEAAIKAQPGWASKTAYNRSQIIYRIAEMMDGRRSQFESEMQLMGIGEKSAARELQASIDRVIHYAGWADKYQQLFSSVNPVAGSYFNFSIPEPTGIVGVVAPIDSGLLGLMSTLLPVICGGNTCIILASEKFPLSAITLAEVLGTSDLPAGVVNILTGYDKEIVPTMSSHMGINGIVYAGDSKTHSKEVQQNAALNVKRVLDVSGGKWKSKLSESPHLIMEMQEIKTTWHPIGI